MNDIEKLELLKNIKVQIVNSEYRERMGFRRIEIKLLVKNNTKYSYSKVYFDIKFFNKDEELTDVAKKWVYDIMPKSESVEIIDCSLNTSDIARFSIKVSDVRLKGEL